MFIAFEGIDGSGKTTVIKEVKALLAEKFGEDKILTTREPGGTPMAEKIRSLLLEEQEEDVDPLTQVLLFSAARRQHLANVIVPAILERKVVITDRFADSTIAYQAAISPRPNAMRASIENITRETLCGWYPELIIWLDIDPDLSVTRRKERGGNTDAMEERVKNHLVIMREIYALQMEHHQNFKPFGNVQWVRIDASAPLPDVVAEVYKAIMSSRAWLQYSNQY